MLDPAVRRLARETLTARQYDVFSMRAQGIPWRTISMQLGVSHSTARSTFDRAVQKLAQASERVA